MQVKLWIIVKIGQEFVNIWEKKSQPKQDRSTYETLLNLARCENSNII